LGVVTGPQASEVLHHKLLN